MNLLITIRKIKLDPSELSCAIGSLDIELLKWKDRLSLAKAIIPSPDEYKKISSEFINCSEKDFEEAEKYLFSLSKVKRPLAKLELMQTFLSIPSESASTTIYS